MHGAVTKLDYTIGLVFKNSEKLQKNAEITKKSKICSGETVKIFFIFPINVSWGQKQEKRVFMLKSVSLLIICLFGVFAWVA